MVKILDGPKLRLHRAPAEEVAGHRQHTNHGGVLREPTARANLLLRIAVPVVQVEGQGCLRVRGNRAGTPSAGSRPASTKQNSALVFTPVPSCSGHVTLAGSVSGTGLTTDAGFAGAGFLVVVRVPCACSWQSESRHRMNRTDPPRRMASSITAGTGQGSRLRLRKTLEKILSQIFLSLEP